MLISEYQKLAMRTSPEGHDRRLNGCMGMIGEAGEIVDSVKKWKFQSGEHADLPKEHLIEECGDVLWYCAELMTGLNDDLQSVCDKVCDEIMIGVESMNSNFDLEFVVSRLAIAATHPYEGLYETIYHQHDQISKDISEAYAKSNVVGILLMIEYILERFLESNLSEAMARNVEKLKRRYPDGFDPERSLHRE